MKLEKYVLPLRNENGIISDARNRPVRLWGMNWHLPFNHNYVNLKESGRDPMKSIDRDIADFERLGVQLVRIHVYDREICDREGHIVENEQLRILDRLTAKLAEKNILLMLTPVTWWNTVVNQAAQEQMYAFWYAGSSDAFGFSNFYSKDALLWHPDALQAQKTYFHEFFTRTNTCTGQKYADTPNLAIVELFNEPFYLRPELIRGEDLRGNPAAPMQWFAYSAPSARKPLLEKYHRFLADNKLEDTDESIGLFNADIVTDYVTGMYDVIDKAIGRPYLKSHIFYRYSAPETQEAFRKMKIDALNFVFYMNGPHGFDSAPSEDVNYFDVSRRLCAARKFLPEDHLSRIVYEFDAPSTRRNYGLGAAACAFRHWNIGAAAYFNYTPGDVAAWNPGWLIHYLNYLHTPKKAAGYAAAGMIFRDMPSGTSLPDRSDCWRGEHYLIRAEDDLVLFYDGSRLCHSQPVSDGDFQFSENFPDEILAVGSSPYISFEGNGIYRVTKESETLFHVEISPDQEYISEPLRARAMKEQANRYVNVNKEPPVSILREETHVFAFQTDSFEQAEIRDSLGRIVSVRPFRPDPGQYTIRFASAPRRK